MDNRVNGDYSMESAHKWLLFTSCDTLKNLMSGCGEGVTSSVRHDEWINIVQAISMAWSFISYIPRLFHTSVQRLEANDWKYNVHQSDTRTKVVHSENLSMYELKSHSPPWKMFSKGNWFNFELCNEYGFITVYNLTSISTFPILFSIHRL